MHFFKVGIPYQKSMQLFYNLNLVVGSLFFSYLLFNDQQFVCVHADTNIY